MIDLLKIYEEHNPGEKVGNKLDAIYEVEWMVKCVTVTVLSGWVQTTFELIKLNTVKWLIFARDSVSLISLDSKFAKLNPSLKLYLPLKVTINVHERLVQLNTSKTAAHLKSAKFCPRQVKSLYSIRNGWYQCTTDIECTSKLWYLHILDDRLTEKVVKMRNSGSSIDTFVVYRELWYCHQ